MSQVVRYENFEELMTSDRCSKAYGSKFLRRISYVDDVNTVKLVASKNQVHDVYLMFECQIAVSDDFSTHPFVNRVQFKLS